MRRSVCRLPILFGTPCPVPGHSVLAADCWDGGYVQIIGITDGNGKPLQRPIKTLVRVANWHRTFKPAASSDA